jgi:hypothetical protein
MPRDAPVTIATLPFKIACSMCAPALMQGRTLGQRLPAGTLFLAVCGRRHMADWQSKKRIVKASNWV